MNNLELIAHRGFSAVAPENTLAAFTAALENQADSVEFDIQLSADNIPVIIHNDTVDRTTNGTGLVREKSLEELKKLEAGFWFNQQFIGEKIPTLQEGLDALKTIPSYIYIEVKNSEFWQESNIKNLVEILIDNEWKNKAVIICFNHDFLVKIRKYSPQIQLGYLVAKEEDYTRIIPKILADHHAIIMSNYQILIDNPTLVKHTKNQGVDIVVWTVDDKTELQKLLTMGIVRIATNCLSIRT